MKDSNVENKVVVITGASSGLGNSGDTFLISIPN